MTTNNCLRFNGIYAASRRRAMTLMTVMLLGATVNLAVVGPVAGTTTVKPSVTVKATSKPSVTVKASSTAKPSQTAKPGVASTTGSKPPTSPVCNEAQRKLPPILVKGTIWQCRKVGKKYEYQVFAVLPTGSIPKNLPTPGLPPLPPLPPIAPPILPPQNIPSPGDITKSVTIPVLRESSPPGAVPSLPTTTKK